LPTACLRSGGKEQTESNVDNLQQELNFKGS
jgi:hypothetical protein